MDIDELNFDLEPAEYLVQVQTFDGEGEVIDTIPLGRYRNPEEAVKVAKVKATELHKLLSCGTTKSEGKHIWVAELTVETVVVVEDEETFAGTIFKEILYNERKLEE